MCLRGFIIFQISNCCFLLLLFESQTLTSSHRLFIISVVMPVQTRRMKENTTAITVEKDADNQHEHRNHKVWAFVGAQSILCTLTFLALLYLNYQIWKQYFFLILWSFVLSHAFKSTLG